MRRVLCVSLIACVASLSWAGTNTDTLTHAVTLKSTTPVAVLSSSIRTAGNLACNVAPVCGVVHVRIQLRSPAEVAVMADVDGKRATLGDVSQAADGTHVYDFVADTGAHYGAHTIRALLAKRSASDPDQGIDPEHDILTITGTTNAR